MARKRVSLTPAQLGTDRGAELMALCQAIGEEGRLTRRNLSALVRWLRAHEEADLPAVAFLSRTIEPIIAEVRVSRAEQAEIQKAIERVLPPADRFDAVRNRREVEAQRRDADRLAKRAIEEAEREINREHRRERRERDRQARIAAAEADRLEERERWLREITAPLPPVHRCGCGAEQPISAGVLGRELICPRCRVSFIVARILEGEETYDQRITGTSHRQAELLHLCGGRKRRESVRLVCQAALIPEPSNPHDRNAIRAEIACQTVGYLPSEDAHRYRKLTRAGFLPPDPVLVSAIIVGGWKRGFFGLDQGHFGVRVDLDLYRLEWLAKAR